MFQRVKIFRKNVLKEKEVLGLLESVSTSPQSTLITVHRSRIVEVSWFHVRTAADEIFYNIFFIFILVENKIWHRS